MSTSNDRLNSQPTFKDTLTNTRVSLLKESDLVKRACGRKHFTRRGSDNRSPLLLLTSPAVATIQKYSQPAL